MTVEIRDRRFADVVGPALEFECLADGLEFTEGPVWDAARRRLIFSDIPAARIYEWSEAGGLKVFRDPSHKANGLALDREGRLLACEHATSRVTRLEADGRITVIADRHGGVELNSPNDIVVSSGGRIYFTDPSYGRMDYYGVAREEALGYRGVYRVDPHGGAPVLLADDFAQPNGLCFSRDERRLYVNDTERMHIRAFDVRDDGSLAGGAVWAEVSGTGDGAPDGMKIDRDGHVYCCGPGGIHVFDHDARCLGVILVPTPVANFAWGDDDRRSLYMTASGSLWRARVRTPGHLAGVEAPATVRS